MPFPQSKTHIMLLPQNKNAYNLLILLVYIEIPTIFRKPVECAMNLLRAFLPVSYVYLVSKALIIVIAQGKIHCISICI